SWNASPLSAGSDGSSAGSSSSVTSVIAADASARPVTFTPMGYKTGNWDMAVSATLHCLTGCAIGEVAGMAIGTAAGFHNAGTVALSIALAFVFGYGLTSLPLLRAGLALGVVIPIALA